MRDSFLPTQEQILEALCFPPQSMPTPFKRRVLKPAPAAKGLAQ